MSEIRAERRKEITSNNHFRNTICDVQLMGVYYIYFDTFKISLFNHCARDLPLLDYTRKSQFSFFISFIFTRKASFSIWYNAKENHLGYSRVRKRIIIAQKQCIVRLLVHTHAMLCVSIGHCEHVKYAWKTRLIRSILVTHTYLNTHVI